MQPGEMHAALKPISWLMGKWKSISAKGKYPTINSFEYCEELTFTSLGQPMLNYSSQTWHAVKKNPMHQESGYLRIKPGTDELSFMVVHNFGLTSLEEGVVNDKTIELRSTAISRMSFAKDPAVREINRKIRLVEETGQLEVVVDMATSNTPLTEHLRIVYEKVE